MKSRALFLFFLAGCCSPVVLGSSAAASVRGSAVERQDTTNDLSVVAGRSILLDCAQPVERVAVGLGGIAEATVISPQEIMINGKAPGETSVILWERGGLREFLNVTVRASLSVANERLDSVRRELKKQLPGQEFKVSAENGSVFLSGTVKDLNSSDRAVEIASVAGKVVNLLNVQVPAPQPQILLKVVFASVDRTKSDQLGLNLFSTGYGNVLGSVSTQQFTPPFVDSTGAKLSDDLNLMAFFPGLNLGATLKALQAKGLVEVLAEPNVLAEDGKQGSFLAGGEYPYPVVQGSGASTSGTSITIMFKEYGIRLNFIPKITPNGNIHLKVAPEVSSLDFANAIQINGFQVPAIAVRRVSTDIELSEGQSFAIGGLLDNRETQTLQKIPFISSVPILGKFFQSISKTKSNTELIVVVTPEIVQPIPGGVAPPKPNFPEGFLPPNSTVPMHTPDDKATGTVPQLAPTAIPVEKLIESMKPDAGFQIDSSRGYGPSSGTGAGNGSPATADQH